MLIGSASTNSTLDDEESDGEQDEYLQHEDEEMNENEVIIENEENEEAPPQKACNCESVMKEDETNFQETEEHEEIVAPAPVRPTKQIKTNCRVKTETEKLSKVVRKLGKAKQKRQQVEEQSSKDEISEDTNEEEMSVETPKVKEKKNLSKEPAGSKTKGNRIDTKSRAKREQKSSSYSSKTSSGKNIKTKQTRAVKAPQDIKQQQKRNTKSSDKETNFKNSRRNQINGKRMKSNTKSEL